MTNQRIREIIRDAKEMIAEMEKEPKLKQIYKDVDFRRILEDGKGELLYRETDFQKLTAYEYGYVRNIFA